ncbi:MAG: DNA translocase FtsK [Oscillospiraceae bacterium]|nr:DNA translocase FtsK [Oscillospiraceae bacterium]
MAQTKQPAKKTGGNGAAKKAPIKKPQAKKAPPKPFFGEHAQIFSVVVFAVSVFLFCVAAFPGSGDSVWDQLRSFHFGLWGFASFLYPAVLVYLAVLMTSEKANYKSLIRFFETVAFVFFISAAIHIFRADLAGEPHYGTLVKGEYARFADTGAVTGSGAVGALFGAALLMISKTRPPAVILILLLLFVFVMLITGSSLAKLISALRTPAEKAGQFTKEKMEVLAAERAKLKEEREAEALNAEEGYPDPGLFKQFQSAPRRKEKKKRNPPFDVELGPPPAKEPVVDEYIAVGDGVPQVIPVGKGAAPRASVAVHEIGAKSEEKDDLTDIFETLQKKEAEESALQSKEPDMLVRDAPVSVEEQSKSFEEWVEDAEEEAQFKPAPAAPPIAEYHLPPIDCLNLPDPSTKTALSVDELRTNADRLLEALKSFNVEAKILDIVPGPSVTRYELTPAPGMKISKFTSLADDLALHLAAPAGVRIEAPIPNKPAIGIEVPNKGRASVPIREIIDSDVFRKAKSKLTVALGKDIAGNCVCADLAKMPHLLIAGTTGSGKSVCLNTLIISLLYNATPSEVKLLLIDPKQVEFSVYNGIPHLLVPVVNDPRKAAGALAWAVTEMVNRYKILNNSGARDIGAYNELCETNPEYEKMPQVVIVIDELSDLMTVAANEVEDSITRLAQMARAAGMHLVVATQRPSVDVITGLIKANIPSRIALSVSSQIDSRTIIDTAGAEKLLGLGDMLFCPVGNQKSLRVQGCYLSSSEIHTVVSFVKGQETSEYDEEIQEEIERQAVVEKKKNGGGDKPDEDSVSWQTDETLKRAIDFVVSNPEACSISSLQRKLSLGFSKAGRYMDLMETQGFVGPSEGSKPRKVLLTKAQWFETQALASAGSISDDPADDGVIQ